MERLWMIGVGLLFVLPGAALAIDCNSNGVDDTVDISSGTSSDINTNDVPDECETTIIRVDQTITLDLGDQDGETWDTAYKDLADAIDEQVSDEQNNTQLFEFWVADGEYYPVVEDTSSEINSNGSFPMYRYVSIYGGFSGEGAVEETNRSQRDSDSNITVLRGDREDGQSYFNIIHADWYTEHSLIDGFTITGGKADNSDGSYYGGGLRVYYLGKPVLKDCIFIDNQGLSAGAVYISGPGSDAHFINCRFLNNTALGDGDNDTGYTGCGGAVFARGGVNAEFVNCEFSGNQAFENSTGSFVGGLGGAFYCFNFGAGYPTAHFENCTFSGNEAENDGGGLYSAAADEITIANSIFWGNFVGSVFDEDAQITGDVSSNGVTYSCIQGCSVFCLDTELENISTNPKFLDDDGIDGVVGSVDDNLRLHGDSPCIDTGSNGLFTSDITVDLDGIDRIVDGDHDLSSSEIIDMGAYEYAYLDCNENDEVDDLDIRNSTSEDTNDNWIPDECEPAPPVLTANSIKQHGSGLFAVNKGFASGEVECRSGGITKIVLKFDQDAFSSDGDNLKVEDFTLSRGSVSSLQSLRTVTLPGRVVQDLKITLLISGVTTNGTFTIDFIAENEEGIEEEYEVCWTYVLGDLDGDGDVDSGDEDFILPYHGEDANSDGGVGARCDVDLDNVVESASGNDDDLAIVGGVSPTNPVSLCQ